MSRSLIASGIAADYQKPDKTVEVFHDVNLEVKQGEILGLFGPNGCGKTTLLRVLAGLKQVVDGKVKHSGWTGEVKRSLIRQDYRFDFFHWLSLLNNIILTLPSPYREHRQHVRTIESLHESLQIEVKLHRRPPEVSGGQLQQAAILRAFAFQPDILIADEPFSALDFSIAGKVRRAFVDRVRKKKIIALVVLHRIEDIVEVCDRAIAIPKCPFTTSQGSTDYALAESVDNRSSLRAEKLEERSFVELLRNVMAGGEHE